MAEQPTVTVSASAQREVPPDSFRIVATVSAHGPNAAAAGRTLVERYSALEASAAQLPTSVTTTHHGVSTWQDGDRHPTWHATRTMSFDGDDLSVVADVAAAAGSAADTSMSGPYWDVDRANPAHAELQADTVHEARARAERYAAALGGTLGNLVQLRDPGTDSWSHGPGRVFATAAGAPGGAPEWDAIDLTPQAQTLSATVEATWYLDLP